MNHLRATTKVLSQLINKICYLSARDCYDILEITHPWIGLQLIRVTLLNMKKRGLVIAHWREIPVTGKQGTTHALYYLKAI